MSWVGIVGDALNLAGGMMSDKKQDSAYKRAAREARFTPWSVSGPGVSTEVDITGKNVSATLDPQLAAARGLLGDGMSQYLSGSKYGDYTRFAQALGATMPSIWQDANANSLVDPALYQQYLGMTMPQAGLTNQYGGLLGGMGAQYQMGMGPGQMQSNAMFGAGLGLLGSAPNSYQDVANQRLGLLREQAAPYEERASNAMLSKLYSMGQLGGHTGGDRMIGEFGRGLGMADLARQVEAQNMGDQLYGRDLQAALSRQGMGANLMQAGTSGLFQGTGLAQSLYGGALGAAGQSYGMGTGIYQGGMDWSNLTNTRAQQRLQNAMDLFGFGPQLDQTQMQTGLAGLQGMLGIDASAFDALKMSGAFGQAETAADALRSSYLAKRNYSMGGSLLSGIGSMMSSYGGGSQMLGGLGG